MVTQERLCCISLFPHFVLYCFPPSRFCIDEFAGGGKSWQENKRICRRLSLSRTLSHRLSLSAAQVLAWRWWQPLSDTVNFVIASTHSNIADQTDTHACTDPLYKCPLRFIIKAACGRRFEEQNMKRIKQIVWSWRDSHAVRRYLSFSSQWRARIPLFLSSLSFLLLHASFVPPSGPFQKACIIVYDASLSGD